jgi:hypothetical protein
MSEWIEIGLPFGPVYDWNVAPQVGEVDSLHKRGLVRPGVLVRFESGDERLIGDVNSSLGECGCCQSISESSIVTHYRIVWTPEPRE